MGVRIRTEGYEHRETLIDDAADLLSTNKTEAIVKSCDHLRQSSRQNKEALRYLATRLEPAELYQVADMLSTSHLEYNVELSVRPSDPTTESPVVDVLEYTDGSPFDE